jgi:hypothetical protein
MQQYTIRIASLWAKFSHRTKNKSEPKFTNADHGLPMTGSHQPPHSNKPQGLSKHPKNLTLHLKHTLTNIPVYQ